MPEGRMLSKSISCSVQLSEVSIEADYLFMRCIPHLDREGRMPGHPSLVKSITCPLRLEVTVESIPALIRELGGAGLVRWYAAGGREVLEFTGFHNHQKGARFDREAESRFPPYSSSATDLLRINSGPNPAEVRVSEVKGSEVEVKESEVEAARGAREQPAGDEAATYRWKVDLETYAEEHGYGPRDRLIAIGEDITAWRTPDGTVVPAADRLRMLKLADGHLEDPKGKAHDRRSALKYVIAQQYDPFTVAKAEDRPKPGTEAAAVRSETPARYRTGGTTHGLVPIGGPKPEPPAPVDFEAERIKRWEVDNPEEAERVRTVIAARIASGQERVPSGRSTRAAWVKAEYRKRVVEAMNRKGAA